MFAQWHGASRRFSKAARPVQQACLEARRSLMGADALNMCSTWRSALARDKPARFGQQALRHCAGRMLHPCSTPGPCIRQGTNQSVQRSAQTGACRMCLGTMPKSFPKINVLKALDGLLGLQPTVLEKMHVMPIAQTERIKHAEQTFGEHALGMTS